MERLTHGHSPLEIARNIPEAFIKAYAWHEYNNTPKGNRPRQIGFILDGNRRWATEKGLARKEGHVAGAGAIIGVANSFMQEGIDFVLWSHAINNWKRSPQELDDLFDVHIRYINRKLPEVKDNNGRIIHLGRKEPLVLPDDQTVTLPTQLIEVLIMAEEETRKNTGPIIALAINYSGEDELRRMEKRFLQAKRLGLVTAESLLSLSRQEWGKFGDDQGKLGEMDLLIRTSGEQRTSAFGWRADNAELYFTNRKLPDFKDYHMALAIADYGKRDIRNGGDSKKLVKL